MLFFNQGDRVTIIEWGSHTGKIGEVTKIKKDSGGIVWIVVAFGDGSSAESIPQTQLRWTITAEEWGKMSDDYKSEEGGCRFALKLTEAGTVLLPVAVEGLQKMWVNEEIQCICCDRMIRHRPSENTAFHECPYPFDVGYGKCQKCQQSNVQPASYEALVEIAEEHQFASFVWPDDSEEDEPLIVDATTAQAMVAVHDGLSSEKQEQFENLIARSRGHFGKMVDLVWKLAS